jgi:hypothetical protein
MRNARRLSPVPVNVCPPFRQPEHFFHWCDKCATLPQRSYSQHIHSLHSDNFRDPDSDLLTAQRKTRRRDRLEFRNEISLHRRSPRPVRRARGIASRLLCLALAPGQPTLDRHRQLVNEIKRVHRDAYGRYSSPRRPDTTSLSKQAAKQPCFQAVSLLNLR